MYLLVLNLGLQMYLPNKLQKEHLSEKTQNLEKAINLEVERQIDILEDGGSVAQETRLYDSVKNETRCI